MIRNENPPVIGPADGSSANIVGEGRDVNKTSASSETSTPFVVAATIHDVPDNMPPGVLHSISLRDMNLAGIKELPNTHESSGEGTKLSPRTSTKSPPVEYPTEGETLYTFGSGAAYTWADVIDRERDLIGNGVRFLVSTIATLTDP